MKKSTLKSGTTGKLESPEKLVVFYAGYIAMRRLWEAKTEKGNLRTGDPELDKGKGGDDPEFIHRIDMEIAHPLGHPTNTLLKVRKFKYWGKKILAMCEKMDKHE